jgi:tungstate transport system substrate-binding protein
LRSICIGAIAVVSGCTERGGETRSIILATTTSTQDTGLLDSLLPHFRAESGIDVKVIAVGTGAALEMARGGNADVVLVHAPVREREYIATGDLTGGRLVMYNDFLLVGPPDDPAGVTGVRDLAVAMRAIASGGAFVSRGDASGTETMELALWRAAGIDPDSLRRRESTGQGMGATLGVADQHRAYTLTDRATYLALGPRLALKPVFEGDPALLNIYHAYVVSPGKHPGVNGVEALRFVEFLTSPGVQRRIGEFGRSRFGRALYVPAAGRDTADLLRGAA